MNTIVLIIGLFQFFTGVAAIVTPGGFRRMIEFSTDRPGLYVAAAVRMLMGILLFWGAAGSRAPGFVYLTGFIFLASGMIMPVLSPLRLAGISAWWAGQSDGTMRLWGLFSALVGAGITWAAL